MDLTEPQKALIALLKRQGRGKALVELAILALAENPQATDRILIWAYDNPKATEEDLAETILGLRDGSTSILTKTAM